VAGKAGSAVGKEDEVTGIKPGSLATVVLAATLLAACSTGTWTSPAGTERYQIGYKDGCDVGYAVAGSPFYDRIEKATEPVGQDDQYVYGWRSGYIQCKTSYDRIQNGIHGLFGA
jgi:hypothetical protein